MEYLISESVNLFILLKGLFFALDKATIFDLVNGSFEIVGAVISSFNIKRIRIDKVVHGFNPWTTFYFTAWGTWNLFYYPALGQWLSFWGGVAIVVVNAVWLAHVIYYKRINKK